MKKARPCALGDLAIVMQQSLSYPMYNAFAIEECHGRGSLQGGHGHSVQVCSTRYGTAAGLEPALLHCILYTIFTQPFVKSTMQMQMHHCHCLTSPMSTTLTS